MVDAHHPAGLLDDLVRDARGHMERGEAATAIRVLSEANRAQRDELLELALAEIRHRGYDRARASAKPAEPGAVACPVEVIDGLPTVTPDALTGAALAGALSTHGCLFIPGLLSQADIDPLVDGIDRAFDALDRYTDHPLAERTLEDRAWFEPFTPSEPYAQRMVGGRTFTRSTGGLWAIESPHLLFSLIDLFERIGLTEAVTGHLGERPALSAAKFNLRRTPVHLPGGWHQDGSFVGFDITSVDAWMALSDCGTDAPGLDLVPHRFDHLLPTGMDGVVIPHSTVVETVEQVGTTIVDRDFRAGDTLLFDHLFLHRTGIKPGMTRDRYALETWFFGPSSYPGSQVPVLC